MDDLCSVGTGVDDVLHSYFCKYRDWTEILGIVLAKLDDPGKVFAPYTQGEFLGLYYNTERSVWYMPVEKGKRLLAYMCNVL